MTASQEQLINDLEQVIRDIESVKASLGPTLHRMLDATEQGLLAPPSPVIAWARGEVDRGVQECSSCADEAVAFCSDCIDNTRHCFLLRQTEATYRAIDFGPALAKTSTSSIAGDINANWVSPNGDEYRRRLEELEKRVMRFQDSVEALVESFAQMASAIEGRDVDLAIGVAGIVVGLVGLLITIETGGTGVGLVVGIVVTVVGLVLTIWGVVRVLTVVPARRDAMIKELSANADSVTSDPWPAGPRLTDEDW